MRQSALERARLPENVAARKLTAENIRRRKAEREVEMSTLRQQLGALQLTDEQKTALDKLTRPDMRKIRLGDTEIEIDMERDLGKFALMYIAGDMSSDKRVALANGKEYELTPDDIEAITQALFEA